MKTCPICHAKTFDDARVCFGCLHDFTKPCDDGGTTVPQADDSPFWALGHAPQARDAAGEAAASGADCPSNGSNDAAIAQTKAEAADEKTKAEVADAQEAARREGREANVLASDVPATWQTAGATQAQEGRPACVTLVQGSDQASVFALQWESGSVTLALEGDVEVVVEGQARMVLRPAASLAG